MGSRVTFESILGHFGVGLPESLLNHFNSFCVSVELGSRPLDNDSKLLRRSIFSTAGSFRFTLQPEIIAKLIPKTLSHVTEMRSSKTILPKQNYHVNL